MATKWELKHLGWLGKETAGLKFHLSLPLSLLWFICLHSAFVSTFSMVVSPSGCFQGPQPRTAARVDA